MSKNAGRIGFRVKRGGLTDTIGQDVLKLSQGRSKICLVVCQIANTRKISRTSVTSHRRDQVRSMVDRTIFEHVAQN